MKTRLAKFISDSGIASRREAERLIESGVVFVNSEKITTPVFFVDGSEKIKVKGKEVRHKAEGIRQSVAGVHDQNTNLGNKAPALCPMPYALPLVLAFHKPIDTLCTRSDPAGRKTVYDVLPDEYKNLKYIGRLDYKTTGLLLLTDDGALARRLTMPETGIKRVYIAKLRIKNFGDIKSPQIIRALKKFLSPLQSADSVFDILRRGATIDGIRYAPMEIELQSRLPLVVKIVLTEGKKNEIRIAFDYIGLPVAKLQRVSYGNVALGNLSIGKIRVLSQKEIDGL